MKCLNSSFFTNRLGLLGLLSGLMICLVGCDKGPKRYSVSGQLQFNGTPVPSGHLVFTPDRNKGNKGPQGVAVVKDGAIAITSRKTVGGAHWVNVQVFDGVPFDNGEMIIEAGKELAPMQMVEIDLPKEANANLTINVKKAAKGKVSVEIEVKED